MIINKNAKNNKDSIKNEDLKGKSNKRLHTTQPTNCECTAAWQNCADKYPEDKVNKPSTENVVDAKDWVDNGSLL